MQTQKVEAESSAAMERALHDLCQPLTTLQCRLELAQMCVDASSLHEAVTGALEDTERLFAGITVMRERLQRALSKAEYES
jgi:hypothetical protein